MKVILTNNNKSDNTFIAIIYKIIIYRFVSHYSIYDAVTKIMHKIPAYVIICIAVVVYLINTN